MISINRTGLPGRSHAMGDNQRLIAGGNLGDVEAQADGTKLFSRGFCPTISFGAIANGLWLNRITAAASGHRGGNETIFTAGT
ncbi:hypothetical protein [Mesorhizobium sp.]|uniref:hypothetical protein n=1 Tax=Mesorhizobium sp. TaxID=1871066 RepID=UPI000FE38808|nr:hypothetical protein [Mesorhizobium sp.]RWH68547.1 MAG: hypothetical protein EOQ84_25370 [Mesorhizobium sp.]RWL24809.1 MAG: hypothetical protein EOR58_21695 [Mesorhizobium sp.]RWL27261.1 MAG: hypothetical protein EOR63_23175 [Mesorhizobium sp.]RWL32247.1 MAG: hypothetical protein EOR59_27320 [Mesorhizobium sp.]RWL44400.1 MAG: hypothetical protein EOR62_31825 [Mesorhizobium sp.]